jgi:hypothetical protein
LASGKLKNRLGGHNIGMANELLDDTEKGKAISLHKRFIGTALKDQGTALESRGLERTRSWTRKS